MCEDWTEKRPRRDLLDPEMVSHSKVQQGEVLLGANSMPPPDGFGINPSACTNGSTGVIPSACTDGATGVIPTACTNGASELR